MPHTIRQSDLEGYLDEALPAEEMARIEKALREDPQLARQAGVIQSRRNAGLHSLGEIWRASRLSCLSREQLGSYLLGVLPDELADYIKFHIETVGCRCCQANLADLQQEQAEHGEKTETRRRRYFESSAGYLRDGTPE
ncbi:MAG: hypothetical protein HQ567_21935 [Candidatus Nealsonbacteria bacterium]|nr:hypothetical protein [Candidatus Nealsonbacteria bacterium]